MREKQRFSGGTGSAKPVPKIGEHFGRSKTVNKVEKLEYQLHSGMRGARQSRPEEAGMVPTVVSRFVRQMHDDLIWLMRQAQFSLSRHANALDRKFVHFEDEARQVWFEWFAAWPPRERPVYRPVLVRSNYDPIERERFDHSSRHPSPMTRGRWR